MKRKTFTFADLRKSGEAAAQSRVFTCTLHRRRKVNCLCRCTPDDGVVALYPDYAQEVYNQQMCYILNCCEPRRIAARAMSIGAMLKHAGRPHLALRLLQSAFNRFLSVEWDLQEDYAHNHYWPGCDYEQWYKPWNWRVSEADARQLAAFIDELRNEVNRQLGHEDRSRLRFRVHDRYESMFDYIYEV